MSESVEATLADNTGGRRAAEIEPFKIAISDDVLADLDRRLAATRWPAEFANDDWRYGANGVYLRELVDHWRHRYDWRETERKINAFNQFRTTIDGVPIHFIHEKGKGPAPVPLILNHGWPWTFWDYQKVINALADPASHGGDPADAFDIILPSLPGYGFSTPLTTPGVNFWTTADLWVKLMARLGYDRFATQGSDWGSIVSAQLGHKYADRLIGAHLQGLVALDMFGGGGLSPDGFADEPEQLAVNANFAAAELGYFHQLSTKPQSEAFAMEDSPVGQLAWIVEKRRTWSGCKGDVEQSFSKDDLIDTTMLYWLTESFGTAGRYYYEARHNPWSPSHDRWPLVEAPVAVAAFPGDTVQQPRRWAERYYNIQRWTDMPAGGHFGAMEEPEAVIQDVRAFFRGLR